MKKNCNTIKKNYNNSKSPNKELQDLYEECSRKSQANETLHISSNKYQINIATAKWLVFLFLSLLAVGIVLLFINKTSIVYLPFGETRRAEVNPYWLGVGIVIGAFTLITYVYFSAIIKEKK